MTLQPRLSRGKDAKRTASRTELDEMYSIAAAVHAVHDDEADAIRSEFPEAPAMLAYLSDGWGCNISSYSSREMGQHVVQRRGRYRREFLIERGVLRVRKPDGTHAVVMFFNRPRGLAYGRGAWNVFSSCCERLSC